jgi:phosphopantothenate---cysteine ligase (CTP)
MRIIVTCGPSYEPIDGARRITNFSTGRLGIGLANAFAARGCQVLCFKGEQATCADPLVGAEHVSFTTNEDLLAQLEQEAARQSCDAVLHAAALCDFRVEGIVDEHGAAVQSAKIPTRGGPVFLKLTPTLKVLPRLRILFPDARIVGWKYELAGTRAEALARSWQQIRECGTDACVLNGAAYGPGFALCRGENTVEEIEDAEELGAVLQRWLEGALPKR